MEFVLIVPLLALLLVAVVARTSLVMAAAAREGARVAATTPDTDRAIEATRLALGDLASQVRVTVRRPPRCRSARRSHAIRNSRRALGLGRFSCATEFQRHHAG